MHMLDLWPVTGEIGHGHWQLQHASSESQPTRRRTVPPPSPARSSARGRGSGVTEPSVDSVGVSGEQWHRARASCVLLSCVARHTRSIAGDMGLQVLLWCLALVLVTCRGALLTRTIIVSIWYSRHPCMF